MQQIKVDAQTDEQWKKGFVNQVTDSEKGWRKIMYHIFSGTSKD